MRRGRRHPDRLGVGDAVDFWRVEAVDADSLVRLRAEMRLPGEAWLEWRIDARGRRRQPPHASGRSSTPGVSLGRAYWYALIPFHALDLRQLAQRLPTAAGRIESDGRLEEHDVLTAPAPRT